MTSRVMWLGGVGFCLFCWLLIAAMALGWGG